MSSETLQSPIALSRPRTFADTVNAGWQALRPYHWLKNGFVLLPAVFSGRLTAPGAWEQEALALTAFCACASSVYLWNDIADRRADAEHPEKKNRPIPSGRFGIPSATALGTALLITGLLAAFSVNRLTGCLILSYVVLQSAYSMWLKNAAILDLMCIALGFVLRVLTGAAAVGVAASHWLLICTFLLALFLGVGKRRNESQLLGNTCAAHRAVLVAYSNAWLDHAATMLASATIVTYGLYTVAPETQARFGNDRLVSTIPFVVYGVLRYLHMMHTDGTAGDPTNSLLRDWRLIVCVCGWAATCCILIYL